MFLNLCLFNILMNKHKQGNCFKQTNTNKRKYLCLYVGVRVRLLDMLNLNKQNMNKPFLCLPCGI